MPSTEPSLDQLAVFRAATQNEPITMVNLLKFREWADYGENGEDGGRDRAGDSAAEKRLSGREAYQRYARA